MCHKGHPTRGATSACHKGVPQGRDPNFRMVRGGGYARTLERLGEGEAGILELQTGTLERVGEKRGADARTLDGLGTGNPELWDAGMMKAGCTETLR